MVAPVTGPFVQYLSGAGLIGEKWWFRQRKPFDLPLAHDNIRIEGRRKIDGSSWSPYSPVGRPTHLAVVNDQHDLYAKAYATAYDHFASKAKNGLSASIGTTLAEAGESFAMIASRTASMLRFVRALKRGRFGEAYDALVDNNRSFKQQARLRRHMGTKRYAALPWSDALLEVSFGWVPLLDDIHSAVTILSQPPAPKPGRVKGRGHNEYSKVNERIESTDYIEVFTQFVSQQVEVGGYVSVENTNLALLNTLGLVNPLSVAWDVIPLSYLVNWFVPVKQWLEGYSTFWGFSLSHMYVSHLRRGWSNKFSLHKPSSHNDEFHDDGYYFHRGVVPVPPVPTLWSRVKIPGPGGALGKTATSVAVLIQQLSNPKRGK